MKSLEEQHIEAVEDAITALDASGYYYSTIKSKLNRLIGYLTAVDEMKKDKEIPVEVAPKKATTIRKKTSK